MSKRLKLALITSLFFINPSMADFVAAEEANKIGDRKTAFAEYQIAANEQDTRAYGKLGGMYLYGLGTEKNYPQAYVWFQMAYLNGDKEAERFRNAASSMMSQAEYEQALKATEAQRIKLNLELK
ncbi:MAG: sel1 repeat family protein [Gammaproteobacteria bacterium]|nr:sel1 repeat family protein [Gammaproteobacteria bacterium]